MNRKEAREFVMQCVFQMEAQHDFENPDIEKYLSRGDLAENRGYAEKLLKAVSGNIERINTNIDNCSVGWPHWRMAKVDLAIVRVAVAELLFCADVPRAVSINEAVNLAKVYGTDQSPKFVNAVLGKVECPEICQ